MTDKKIQKIKEYLGSLVEKLQKMVDILEEKDLDKREQHKE